MGHDMGSRATTAGGLLGPGRVWVSEILSCVPVDLPVFTSS